MPTLEMEPENYFETTQGQFQKTYFLHLQGGEESCLQESKVPPKTSMATREHGVTLQNTVICYFSLLVRPEYPEDVGSSFLSPNYTTTHPKNATSCVLGVYYIFI